MFKAYKVLLDNVFDCIKGFFFVCVFCVVFVMDVNLILGSMISNIQQQQTNIKRNKRNESDIYASSKRKTHTE